MWESRENCTQQAPFPCQLSGRLWVQGLALFFLGVAQGTCSLSLSLLVCKLGMEMASASSLWETELNAGPAHAVAVSTITMVTASSYHEYRERGCGPARPPHRALSPS